MSATKSGVTADQNRIAVAKKAAELAGFLLSDKGSFPAETLQGLDQMVQAVTDGFGFKIEVLKPRTLAAFLKLGNRTEGIFNQLASELAFWTLLDQVEELCFLQPDNLAILQPFIEGLWAGEVAANPFQPPVGWKYLPPPAAVAAYSSWLKSVFGSETQLRAEATLNLAATANPRPESEGVAVWPKLTTLARLFEVNGNPLEITEEGREAYTRIVELFVPKVGSAFITSGLGGFNNWREGQLSAQQVILTPAGITTWRRLEQATDDDFCLSPAGATTGAAYGGHSLRFSRLKIVLATTKFPQDCLMTGSTIAIQPERMSKSEYLHMDCPANAYSPDAGGQFDYSLCWLFSEVNLHFGSRRLTGNPHRYWGAACGSLS